MKTKWPLLSIGIAAALALSSCATNQHAAIQRKQDIVSSKDQDMPCFVQWKDGKKQHFQQLELVTGMFKTPYLLADDKLRIQQDQIIAYQNSEHYAVSQNTFANGRKSYIAVETLPGFAIRVAKGKFNLYAKKFNKGQHTGEEYYIQEGDKGPIYACTNEVMEELLLKDPESFDFVFSKVMYAQKAKKQQSMYMQVSSGSLTKNK